METIARLHDLWPSRLPPDPGFERFFDHQVSYQEHVRRWFGEVQTLWVYKHWCEALEEGELDFIPRPQEIWLDAPGEVTEIHRARGLARPDAYLWRLPDIVAFPQIWIIRSSRTTVMIYPVSCFDTGVNNCHRSP
ncbi:hypothetical protein BJY01DRAFT_229051 [Aspergillus pseudoustus]|uniref:Uncharacterized protein n=1 Tax=Aspergillus pseudoustus TaxID=1810923 RepID=A0ABR4IIC4_9EURO